LGLGFFDGASRKLYGIARAPGQRRDTTRVQAAAGLDDNTETVYENHVDREAHTEGVNLSTAGYHQCLAALHEFSPDEASAALARRRCPASIRSEQDAL